MAMIVCASSNHTVSFTVIYKFMHRHKDTVALILWMID